jgi:hypothetical protein
VLVFLEEAAPIRWIIKKYKKLNKRGCAPLKSGEPKGTAHGKLRKLHPQSY